MIVFLFGLPGVGKTYIGQLMQRELGVCYWDGDEALTEEMKRAVRNEQSFSRQMTADLTSTIINQIQTLRQTHDFVIVSQAMLREVDRQTFREQFDDIHFIYIRCEADAVITQRITQRADFVTVSYCDKLMKLFEAHRGDAEAYPSIDNNNKTDEELITAFKDALNSKLKADWEPGFFPEPKAAEPGLGNQTEIFHHARY